jgi:hypothetical protein
VAGSCKQGSETMGSKTNEQLSVVEELLDSQEGLCSVKFINPLFSYSFS